MFPQDAWAVFDEELGPNPQRAVSQQRGSAPQSGATSRVTALAKAPVFGFICLPRMNAPKGQP